MLATNVAGRRLRISYWCGGGVHSRSKRFPDRLARGGMGGSGGPVTNYYADKLLEIAAWSIPAINEV